MSGLKVVKALGWSLLLTALLAGLDLARGGGPALDRGGSLGLYRLAWRFAFGLGALLLGWWGMPRGGRRDWARNLAVAGLALGLALVYWAWPGTALAWAALTSGCGALIALEGVFGATWARCRRRWVSGLTAWGVRLLLAALGGLVPVALVQIQTHFAEEEFFALLQGLILAGVISLLLIGSAVLRPRGVRNNDATGSRSPRAGMRVYALLVAIGLAGGLAWLGARTLDAYQASFAPETAPGYPGITAESPFLCGQVPPAEGNPSGQDVYERALHQVEMWPERGPRELALLALGYDDTTYAEAFRQAVLTEARAGALTGATHSLKGMQFEASLWLYYTALVQEAFPDLFSADDKAILEDWFAAINESVWRVEWVDVLYGLALGAPPEGPYANQGVGAGLLALLEAEGWGAQALSAANQDYLARPAQSWLGRFRNPDDAYFYQTVWINNAHFQSLLHGASPRNQGLSFEWLLLQALPDGETLRYNSPEYAHLVGIWYKAVQLLGDARYVWLADRALSRAEHEGTGIIAYPSLEKPVSLQGRSPTVGSCLIYGDSGLPFQLGPLAPDKVVFRDGWRPDAAYLLLNLRFTGWHRYKATNAIVQVYQDGPLVVEAGDGEPVHWLPQGRQAFRDKRIPRENLNGLLVPRDGLDAAIQTLTGLGSPWAQDPPHYAEVETFQALGPLDVGRTTLRDWRGWTHSRSIYLLHDGPIVVVDDAHSDQARPGAVLTWHLVGEARRQADGLWLRSGESPARVVLPGDAWKSVDLLPTVQNGENGVSMIYSSPQDGQLHLVTAFLTRDWAAADFDGRSLADGAGHAIRITGEGVVPTGEYRILHNSAGGWVETDGLGFDGLALAGWWPTAEGQGWLCYVEANRVEMNGDLVFATDGPALSGCVTLEVVVDRE